MKYHILSSAYSALWTAALPFLGRKGRLAEGREQRVLKHPLPKAAIWIQAASTGEAYLAWELLKNLAGKTTEPVLVTTITPQGMEILERAKNALDGELTLHTAYLPFDKPSLMQKAMAQVSPKVVALLETELWPGLLEAARGVGVPVVTINGRMKAESMAGYMLAPWFWREAGPTEVLAISREDAMRFELLMGAGTATVMHNIKFDRISTHSARSKNPLTPLFAPKSTLLVMASIRRQEETDICRAVATIHDKRPKTTLAIFPKHLKSIPSLQEQLSAYGLRDRLASELKEPAEKGSVIIWDRMGELVAAYRLAAAAFVGGSLYRLGGQNFLEATAAGVVPIIGPHWKNFAWVGRDYLSKGLAQEIESPDELASTLLHALAHPAPKTETRTKLEEYVSSRRGGALQAAQHLLRYLD